MLEQIPEYHVSELICILEVELLRACIKNKVRLWTID